MQSVDDVRPHPCILVFLAVLHRVQETTDWERIVMSTAKSYCACIVD
jgi:hypothetical protein